MHRTSSLLPPALFSSTIARTGRGKASGFTSAIAFSLFLSISAFAQDKVAATPLMGWNSWNHFAERIDDKTVRETAAALVSTGLKDAGYFYLNIDDTWEGQRDARGFIHSNEKFPDMKALADYVHSHGMKLAIY